MRNADIINTIKPSYTPNNRKENPMRRFFINTLRFLALLTAIWGACVFYFTPTDYVFGTVLLTLAAHFELRAAHNALIAHYKKHLGGC